MFGRPIFPLNLGLVGCRFKKYPRFGSNHFLGGGRGSGLRTNLCTYHYSNSDQRWDFPTMILI